jgi:SAM-dependent methyltransferase
MLSARARRAYTRPAVARSLVWRMRAQLRRRVSISLPARLARLLPPALGERFAIADPTAAQRQWLRAVMIPDTRRAFEQLGPSSMHVAEISGDLWTELGWASREQFDFPEFDLCDPPAELPGPFDLVICEQVLEHVPDPLKALDTLRRLCKPDGHVYVSTPFLVRLHDWPGDYWRFTPDGMELLLRASGLEPVWVRSWGNRDVAVANFDHWVPRLPWQSLRNEPALPVTVWALARPAQVAAAERSAAADGR